GGAVTQTQPKLTRPPAPSRAGSGLPLSAARLPRDAGVAGEAGEQARAPRRHVADVQIHLRERDLDAELPEGLDDRAVQIARRLQAFAKLRDVGPLLEVHRAFAEP